MPYAPLEAMLLRKPIVITDITGSRDIIQDGSLGVLVPPGDAARLSEAILQLLRDKGRAERIGKLGEESIRRRFDTASSVSKVTGLYQKLLTSKGNHR